MEKISKEQYLWLVDKGIIHEGMMVNLNGCDYIDYKITKIFPCRYVNEMPKLQVQNMEDDKLGLAKYKKI